MIHIPQYGAVMYDIFISYRTTHSQWVEILAINLKNQGYRVFLDRWELIPGQDFATKLHEALSSVHCAILVATPDTSDSGWVQQELQSMLNRKNEDEFFFIPVVMGEFPDLPFLETVQAVDFGDSGPGRYRRAFQRLICGIEQRPPGPNPCFEGNLRLPETTTSCRRELVPSERSFLERVFNQLDRGRPLMILAQADTNTQLYGRALRKTAKSRYGRDNVFHVFPPNSDRADRAAYFGRLARQCHFQEAVHECWEWAEILEEKLDTGQELFLLVSGFENGADESRAELAGELRWLNERYDRFRLVMMGSKRLAALKHAHGIMSLLNTADELPIPEPAPSDLSDIFGSIYPRMNLSLEQIQAVLGFTGGHPRLLHHCLQQGADSADGCRQVLAHSPLPGQLFSHLHDQDSRSALCSLLQTDRLGTFNTWPADRLLRKLYWNNLITDRHGAFAWRCDFIRRTGLEMLACG